MAKFTPRKKFQGWKGIVHGGILATLLEEAMSRLASELFSPSFTVDMTVRYHAPAPIGEPLFIRGELVADSRHLIGMKSSLTDASGKIIAAANGRVMRAHAGYT